MTEFKWKQFDVFTTTLFLVKRFCPENMLFLAEIGARVLFGMFCCQSLSNMTIKGKIFIGLFITKTDYL